MTFLGAPRSTEAAEAHEASPLMTVPMAILAAACARAGPLAVCRPPGAQRRRRRVAGRARGLGLSRVDAAAARRGSSSSSARRSSRLGACLLALRPRAPRRVPTWDCGYASPTARMQYTSASFGAALTAVLPGFLTPASLVEPPGGAFPGAASFRTEAPDPFGAKLYEPFTAWWAGRLARLRRLQSGRLTLYLVYVFLTMLVTLAWSVLRPYVR